MTYSWEERRDVLVQKHNGNLRHGALEYLQYLRERNYHGYSYQFMCKFVFEFNDDAEIISAIDKLLRIPLNDLRYNILLNLSPRLQNNKEFMMNMIQGRPYRVQYFPLQLRNDPETMLEILSKEWANSNILRYSSNQLLGNKEFMVKAVKLNGKCIRFAQNNLYDDEEVVSEAVRQNGTALECSSPRMRDNKQVVLLAIQNRGLAIRSASPRIKSDFDVMLAAVRKFGDAIDYAPASLKRNVEIAVSADLQRLQLPTTTTLLNQHQQRHPVSLFPYILERANRNPMILYYILKNRPDLIPSLSSSDSNKKRKRDD